MYRLVSYFFILWAGMVSPVSTVMASDNPEVYMEKANVAYSLLMDRLQKPISEVERMPIHFYEDGISSLKGRLSLRETIAIQHWRGNSKYSFNDVFEQVLPLMSPLPKRDE